MVMRSVALLALSLAVVGGSLGVAQPLDRGVTSPGQLIVSETAGLLWLFDLENHQLSLHHAFGFAGNFDIQYLRPAQILVANLDGALQQVDLITGDVQTLASGSAVGHPIGVTVVPGDGYYLTDHFNARRVLRYDPGSGQVEEVITLGDGGSFDGIAHDARGRLLVTSQSGQIYRVDPARPELELIAEVPHHALNGIVVTPRVTAVVASHQPPAIFEVDLRAGSVAVLWEGDPLRNPEDVALDQHGTVYIVDSDFQRNHEDCLPGIYALNTRTSTLEPLHTGAPLGDVVDLLLTPFRGYR